MHGWIDCREGFDPWAESGALHVGLLPLPFIGDVRGAKVYFLLANPGLSANDYYAEYEDTRVRERLLANLRQDLRTEAYPFFPLDPNMAWHSGNGYWERKQRRARTSASYWSSAQRSAAGACPHPVLN